MSLEEQAKDFDDGTRKILLNDSEISTLGDISRFKRLKNLALANNDLQQFSLDHKTLKFLILDHNQLQKIDINCNNLVVLKASHNKLETLPRISPALESLVLNNNQLTDVSVLGKSPHKRLRTIALSHNLLGSLMLKCPSLVKLSVTKCGLSNLSFLNELPSLVELKASSNNFTKIPKNLNKNQNLKVLDLGTNKVSKIKYLQRLEVFESLKNFRMWGNPVSEEGRYLETCYDMFPNLQVLDQKSKDGKSKKRKRDDKTNRPEKKRKKKKIETKQKKQEELVEEKVVDVEKHEEEAPVEPEIEDGISFDELATMNQEKETGVVEVKILREVDPSELFQSDLLKSPPEIGSGTGNAWG